MRYAMVAVVLAGAVLTAAPAFAEAPAGTRAGVAACGPAFAGAPAGTRVGPEPGRGAD